MQDYNTSKNNTLYRTYLFTGSSPGYVYIRIVFFDHPVCPWCNLGIHHLENR